MAARLELHRLKFLDPRERTPAWSAWETGALALYLAVVGFGIAQHVPWADEAQAWMLAQDVGLQTLYTHSLHYEGTPGLWHGYFKLLQLFHVSFTAMRWVSGGIAAAGVAVLLRFAPFPRVIRLLLPFTFFLAYQDAVIARSYVLFAVLAFAAAAMLRSGRPRPRPLLLALVLGLMAHISVHGAIASGGLALVAVGLWSARVNRWRGMAALGLLLAFWAGAIACMVPAADIDFPAGNNVERSIAKAQNQVGLKRAVPPSLSGRTLANLPPTLPAVHVRTGAQGALNKLRRLLSVVTYPLSSYRTLALLLVVLVGVQAWLRRPGEAGSAGPLGLLPYLLMVAVFGSLYLAPRHAGMIFTTFVVTAWLTWPDGEQLAGRRLLLGRVTAAVFVTVLAVQVIWTLHALHEERSRAYAPDRMAADYLKQRGAGEPGKVAAGFYYYSVGPLLYFEHNIYWNQPPHRYWLWSMQTRDYKTVQEVLAKHPEFILVGGAEAGPDAEITRDWQPNTPAEPGVRLGDSFLIGDYYWRRGYRETQVFCGHSWMRSTYAERLCETVLEPDRPGGS